MAEKILVVDDDIDSLKLIGLMLQRHGYEVVMANAGGPALTKATAERPDLIILDVMMPDMSGYEVCRRLRKNAETKGIPVIMFTAKTLIDDKVAGFEAGADDYLTKPTHPAELASRVRAILARNTSQRPVTLHKGSTIGVLGVKGGVGTTTLALNIAAARHAAGDVPVVTDIRPGMGSLGLALGFGRAHGVANLLTKTPEDMTPKAIEAEIVQHTSGLRALLSSARPREGQIPYNPETAAALARSLRAIGRPTVFDLGSGLTPNTLRLQKEMDQLILVTDPLPLTLSMAREILVELEPNRPEGTKLHVVVVNRAASGAPPSWHEVEQLLGREIRAVIGLASELAAQSLQAGMPAVMYQPNAIVSSQMIKLAEELNVRVKTPASGEVPSP
ncbi:response regulator [Anaerolineae bacterium CFX9]|jgi:pilus assembly protein CpaE|nr:response regulator [Kamptonema cortianum]MDL1900836.1 response regulator [Anaerolineae bacterium CFX9]